MRVAMILLLLSTSALATDLNLTVRSGDSHDVVVRSGATIAYEIVAELTDDASQGLAGFRFDLAFEGGPLSPGELPASPAMAAFASPLGYSNPGGFGGTPVAGTLRQVGGAQNTVNAAVGEVLTGQVELDVASRGRPTVLLTGVLEAPPLPGRYLLAPSRIAATVIAGGSTGHPHWTVETAALGNVTPLSVTVAGFSQAPSSPPLAAGSGLPLGGFTGSEGTASRRSEHAGGPPLASPSVAQHIGDVDADGDVDLADVAAFAECARGPGVPTPGGQLCWAADTDLDVDVDLADYMSFQLAMGTRSPPPTPVMGRFQGEAQAPDGNVYDFQLALAQRGHRIFGMGEVVVDPFNPISGVPAVRLLGSIQGGRLVLSMSGRLDLFCSGLAFETTDASVITVKVQPGGNRLVLDEVFDYLPVGCERPLTSFAVIRADEDFVRGNTELLGTWNGGVSSPEGAFFFPQPLLPERLGFFDEGGLLTGYLEFLTGEWGKMILDWDPAAQRAEFFWPCVSDYVFIAFVAGNKLSGFWRFATAPDEEFLGIVSHDLGPRPVPPAPFMECPGLP